MSKKSKKAKRTARDEELGFYLGPFPKNEKCQEPKCRERAFSATDDNRVRCYEHTLAHIEACAAKAVTVPKTLFDGLTEQIKTVQAMRSARPPSPHREIEDPRAPGQTVIGHAFVPLTGSPYCAECGWPSENHMQGAPK